MYGPFVLIEKSGQRERAERVLRPQGSGRSADIRRNGPNSPDTHQGRVRVRCSGLMAASRAATT
jgi:hypothetical protein